MTAPGADGVLLIHGASHGAWVWDDMAPLLDLPYLAINLPGRGVTRTPPASLGSLTLDDLIMSAAADLDSTGWDRAVVVGHSLGGAVAAGLAALAPGRTCHLFLISANVPDPGQCILDGWPPGLRWLPRTLLALRPGGSGAPVTMSTRRARRGLANDLDDTQAARLLGRLVPETPGFVTSQMPDRTLPAAVPRTYLVTRRDQIHKPRRQAAVAAHLGAAIIEIDSGHDPMLSQPAAVAAIVNQIAASPVPQGQS